MLSMRSVWAIQRDCALHNNNKINNNIGLWRACLACTRPWVKSPPPAKLQTRRKAGEDGTVAAAATAEP